MGGASDSHDFRVGRGVGQSQHLVTAPPYQAAALIRQNGAGRNFALGGRIGGLFKGLFHKSLFQGRKTFRKIY
jgi:hypothetical protein